MKRLALISLAIISFAACTEKFDVDLDSTYIRIVVQGSITNEYKKHQVYITKSADYFSDTPAPTVSGALVSITDGSSTYNLTEVTAGIYETDSLAGEIGKTYTLNIETEGNSYTASSFLNYCPPMDSIRFGFRDYSKYYEVKDTILAILMNAQEPSTPNNYYLWNVYVNGILETDTLQEKILYDDVFVNGNYMYDLEVQYAEANTGDTVKLEIQSVTEDYYNYYYEILQETVWSMGPLDGPPANPKGNIFEINDNENNNDNPLGFFLAYSKDTLTKIVPPENEWIELELF